MSARKSQQLLVRALGAMCFAAASTAFAAGNVVYSSIPKDLPGNVASFGAEAYAFSEVGDGMNVGTTPGALTEVSVVMSSWACGSGNWYSGNCVTKNGSKFDQLINLNIYSVVDVGGVPAPGLLLATTTESFKLPYRPTSTPAKCGGDAGAWYSDKDKSCYHGIAETIKFNLASLHIALPSKIIVGVSYNTSHYGPSPLGEATACYSTSAGCPYDSLNVGTDGNGGLVGSTLDPSGIFVNYTSPSNSCGGAAPAGVLALDAGCWDGYHPLIEVKSDGKKAKAPKGGPAPS